MVLLALSWLLLSHAVPGQAFERGEILFSSPVSGAWQLWSVQVDGSRLTRLSYSGQGVHSPAVSPDRNEIVFVNEKRMLVLGKADGSDSKELPLPVGIYAQPAWAPDGNLIAYVKYTVKPSDQSEIWAIRRQGGRWLEPHPISTFPPMRLFPSFSPDGKNLAFTQFHRDKLLGVVEEIGIRALGQPQFKKITDFAADSFQPRWSPTGEWIVYTSNKGGNYDLWLISPDGKRQKQLTRDAAYDGGPSWSPDGHEIAFTSSRTGHREIWIVSENGEDLRQVTHMGMTVSEPCWVK